MLDVGLASTCSMLTQKLDIIVELVKFDPAVLIIARMETGKTSPQLDTVLKVLASLGKTLAVVPLEQEKV